MVRPAASIALLVSTQTVSVRRAAPYARADNIQQVVLLWRVTRAVLASTQPLELTAAWLVRLARVTATAMPRRRVRAVRVVGMRVQGLQTVLCVQLVRLTWTLMPRLCAVYAHRDTMLVLARHRALLVRLVSTTTMRTRAQHARHVV